MSTICGALSNSISDYYYHEFDLYDNHGEHWVTRAEFISTSGASILILIVEVVDPIFCNRILEENRSWSKKLHEMAIEVIAIPLGFIGLFFPGMVNQYVLRTNLAPPA